MPGKAEWLDALSAHELGPVRGKMAVTHRIGASGRRFLEGFKALHQARAPGPRCSELLSYLQPPPARAARGPKQQRSV